jgi:hypothetical protein
MTSESTVAQNDISTVTKDACVSGSNVVLIVAGKPQKKKLMSLPDVALKRDNVPRISLAIGMKFESINTWVSASEVSLMYTMSFMVIDSKNSANAAEILRGLIFTCDARPKRLYRSNSSSEGTWSLGQCNAAYRDVLTWGLLGTKKGLSTGRCEIRFINEFVTKCNEKFKVKRAFETAWGYKQNKELSDTHATLLQLRLSKMTSIEFENEPNPLALKTKATIWDFEHSVELKNMHDEEFNEEAFMKENRRPTLGSRIDAWNAIVCELMASTEVVKVSRAPSPQADLHESDESEVHLDHKQEVPATAMLGDAEYKPNIPCKSITELPVLKKEEAQKTVLDIEGNVPLAFESRTEITNEALPTSWGNRNKIAESDDHTVARAAERWTPTRELSPFLPKLVPSRVICTLPEETPQVKMPVKGKTDGSPCTVPNESEAMALSGILKARTEIFPLKEARRQVAQVSLVQSEPVQDDLISRAATERAMFENDLPDIMIFALPVVAKRPAESAGSNADVPVTTGSG